MDHREERLCYCVKCGRDEGIRCHRSTWSRRDREHWQYICNRCRVAFALQRKATPLFDLLEDLEWARNAKKYRK